MEQGLFDLSLQLCNEGLKNSWFSVYYLLLILITDIFTPKMSV